jgi:short-subunit dehydrogenase
MKIIISGASSGIGQALAYEYAKRYPYSDTIIGLISRRSEHLHQTADELTKRYQVNCAYYPCDVRDSQALANAANDFLQRFGAPNIVIANAGVSRGTLSELQEDIPAFQAIMDINVMGMVHLFQPFIAAMKQATHDEPRHLVGVASVAGIRGLPGASAYCASKAAAISYLESLRVEMLPHGIQVTTITPGYIRTPMTDVNTFPMPFLMESDVFAEKFANAVARKKRFVVIPWQMGITVKLMRLIPAGLWDWAMRNAPKKTRTNWDWL